MVVNIETVYRLHDQIANTAVVKPTVADQSEVKALIKACITEPEPHDPIIDPTDP